MLARNLANGSAAGADAAAADDDDEDEDDDDAADEEDDDGAGVDVDDESEPLVAAAVDGVLLLAAPNSNLGNAVEVVELSLYHTTTHVHDTRCEQCMQQHYTSSQLTDGALRFTLTILQQR